MAVDVVVPCYNGERYLGEALDSVFAQGDLPLRVILVDDGSTDGSAGLAAAYGNRVRVHRQANAGIAAARNAGIALASAPWLAFLDADDLWTAGSLAVRLERFAASPRTDVVFGRLEQFHSPELDAAARARLPIDPSPADARFAGTLLARRESFVRAGGFAPALKVGEMIEWIARAQVAALVIDQVDAVVLRRRVHGANTVLRQGTDRSAYLRALKAAIDLRRGGAAT